ncbi:hypothetical protein Tco_0773960 [Tanacetum coccineum]|uniref:Uncharacterized protein n=1 Tax=Tanacetum coccineum TaxID=301880 RepID=A0ABQ4ZM52_9ASTR
MIPETTLSSTQPPPKRSKTKQILKKSKKVETQVDTEVLDKRLTRLEKKVEALSRFNIPEAINKSIKAYLINNVLPKDAPDFGKTRQEKATNLKINLLRRRDVEMTRINILQQIQKIRRRRESKRILSLQRKIKIKIDPQRKYAGEFVKEDVVDAEDPSQADANVPKSDKSTWFKMIAIERPESPDPEWHKNLLLMMPQNNLDQLDWVNLKGDRIPHDLSKPLPLHGASGRLTIPVEFFFNKDLDYLTTGNVEKKYATSLIKPKAARYDLEGIEEMISKLWSSSKSSHKVYSRMKILSIIRMSDDKQFGYGYLKEIIVRCANQKEYTFKEAAFPRLHLNDIEDMYLLYTQNKLHHLISDEQTDLQRVKVNQKARILEIKRRNNEEYCSDNPYAVSIKEDTAYPCLKLHSASKKRRLIRRIQMKSIRRIGLQVMEYSGI